MLVFLGFIGSAALTLGTDCSVASLGKTAKQERSIGWLSFGADNKSWRKSPKGLLGQYASGHILGVGMNGKLNIALHSKQQQFVKSAWKVSVRAAVDAAYWAWKDLSMECNYMSINGRLTLELGSHLEQNMLSTWRKILNQPTASQLQWVLINPGMTSSTDN